jgi:hypothetical protein
VGGKEQRHFAGTNFQQRKVPKNAHAVPKDGSPTITLAPDLQIVRLVQCRCAPDARWESGTLSLWFSGTLGWAVLLLTDRQKEDEFLLAFIKLNAWTT